MDLIPYDQDKRIMEAQTAKTKDQKPVIKMVTSVEQATEMVKSEIKRECEMAKHKTFVSSRAGLQMFLIAPFTVHC